VTAVHFDAPEQVTVRSYRQSVTSIRWWPLTVTVAVLAFAARLVPVLRGAGLFGLGDYDDGVYYSAAVGFVHGRLPYRDFLILHPPGIVLALAPFAAVGRLFGDPVGFALARLGWMALGALNAVLVVRILRSQGRFPAFLGGVFYAMFVPALYSEHTTQLEGPGTTCVLIALLLLSSAKGRTWRVVGAAGAALGVSTSIKIWGVVAVLIAVGWLLLTPQRRRVGWLLLGAAGGAIAVCLPFFVWAPAAMFRMVVLDQLGRPPGSPQLVTRLTQLSGLWTGPRHSLALPLVATLLGFAVIAVLAALKQEARLALALLVGLTGLLMLIPTWFPHYASLIAGPAAVTVGFGAGQLVTRIGARSPRAGLAVAGVLTALVAGYVVPISHLHFGHSFPGKALGTAVGSASGCVTSDHSTALVEMNVLGRNLDRGCALVVDLGGQSYEDRPARTRSEDSAWQRYALGYLRTGTIVIIARFSAGTGFSPATAATVKTWPVLHRVDGFALRRASLVGAS
jgi:alpha-1,2-mannosyltransferase